MPHTETSGSIAWVERVFSYSFN